MSSVGPGSLSDASFVRVKMIRVVSGILATIGIGWALSAFMGLVMPFIVVACFVLGEDVGAEGGIMLLVSFQVYFGYFIWIGWVFRALNSNFVIPTRVLWIISAVHHSIWIAILASGAHPNNFNGFTDFIFAYLGVVAAVSTLFIFIDRDTGKAERAEALNT